MKTPIADQVADSLDEDMVRFNIDLPREFNVKLNAHFPHGTKGRGVTQLLRCLDEYLSSCDNPAYGVVDLLNGELVLVKGKKESN